MSDTRNSKGGGIGQRLDRLADIQTKHGERLDGVTARLDGVTARLDGVTERLDGVTERLDGVTARLDGVTARLDGVTERLDRLVDIQQAQGQRLDRLAEGQVRGFTAVVDAIGQLGERLDHVLLGPLGTMVRRHDEAIGELRARVSQLEVQTD